MADGEPGAADTDGPGEGERVTRQGEGVAAADAVAPGGGVDVVADGVTAFENNDGVDTSKSPEASR